MSLIEAVELFSVLINGRVFPVHKVKEVPRHCCALAGSWCEPICRAGL